ncbi:hypothetical protein LCGC14_0937960 [marine sediment metagenome]|uniref:Uncharacterized protein n=1 Tax=marine sediment metagenome TaxID=412755 RepID=A0A0F9NQK7_9ZZZZ
MNFALLVKEETKYPVTYTIKQNGDKVIGNTKLKGGDLTENQIKQLYFSGYFTPSPAPSPLQDK